MSSRPGQRTQVCDAGDARRRLADARAQLSFAGLATEASSMEEQKAAISCAVLAGIAASDAACCRALGRRSRSQDHRDAVELVRLVQPGGAEASRQLGRLLVFKDRAQYGLDPIGGGNLRSAIRQAEALVAFAERILVG